MSLRTFVLPIGALVALLAVPSTALAAKRPLKSFDATMARLPLGQDVQQAARWFRDRCKKSYRVRLKRTRDADEKRNLKAERQAACAPETLRVVRLAKRQQTGYEGTIIADEVAAGTSESVLTLRDADGEHHFFFFRDLLYKYARTDGEALRAPFGNRIRGACSSLGEPVATFSSSGSADDVTEAHWTGTGLRMKLVDQRRGFGVDLLVVEDADTAHEVEQLRHKRRSLDKLSPELEQLLQRESDVARRQK